MAHNSPAFVLFVILGLSADLPLTHIFGLCLAFFPVFSWTLLCPDYIALFYLLLMCSNNVCRRASPILSTVSVQFAFRSVLTSSLYSQPHTTPQKPFRILYCIHLFIMRLLLSSLSIPRLSSPSFIDSRYILYADSTHTQHTRKYMPSTAVVLSHSDTFLVESNATRCVLMRTKRQDCASQLLPQQPLLQPCTLVRRTPGGSGSPCPHCQG